MKSNLLFSVIILIVFACIAEPLKACTNFPDPSIDAIKEIEGQDKYTAYTYQDEIYVTVNKEVEFTCSAVDLDDDSMTYTLDYNYNDGVDDSGSVPPAGKPFYETHTYTTTGTYTVRLTVTDNDGSSWVEITVHVEPEKVHNETKDFWYSRIQVAIDRSDNYNILEASTGTYLESIDFLGKDITLTSIDPYDSAVVKDTIIKGNDGKATVTFSGTETDCVFTGFTVTSKSLDDDLEAHWKLDYGSGSTAYDFANNYNGTITGPSWNSTGHINKCLSFDGTNDYVDLPHVLDPGNTTNDAFSAFAWVKDGGNSQVILDRDQVKNGCRLIPLDNWKQRLK